MGLFGDKQKVKDYSGKINELKTKIAQLEGVGMVASAARLKKDLARLERADNTPEKVKPMGVGELKAQLRAQKATNAGKAV